VIVPANTKTIAVDFDGVLNDYKGYEPDKIPPPAKGAHKFLGDLRKRGYGVVIHTARDAKDVTGWLRRYGMHKAVDKVTNTKVPAHAYIDDRAILHKGKYSDTLSTLDKFKPHWEEITFDALALLCESVADLSLVHDVDCPHYRPAGQSQYGALHFFSIHHRNNPIGFVHGWHDEDTGSFKVSDVFITPSLAAAAGLEQPDAYLAPRKAHLWTRHAAGFLGATGVRHLLRQLKTHLPSLKTVWSTTRISGIRNPGHIYPQGDDRMIVRPLKIREEDLLAEELIYEQLNKSKNQRGWITPENEFYDVGSADHLQWLAKNAKVIERRHYITPTHDVMLAHGWIKKYRPDLYVVNGYLPTPNATIAIYQKPMRWYRI
jgi:hypothetical protein